MRQTSRGWGSAAKPRSPLRGIKTRTRVFLRERDDATIEGWQHAHTSLLSLSLCFSPFSDDDKPYVLSVVRKAEALIAADKTLNKEYLDVRQQAKQRQSSCKAMLSTLLTLHSFHPSLCRSPPLLQIAGDSKFVGLARGVLFGADSPAIKEGRMVSAQSLSGTGALRVGCEFIAKHPPKGTTVYYSKVCPCFNSAFTAQRLSG